MFFIAGMVGGGYVRKVKPDVIEGSSRKNFTKACCEK